MNGKPKFDPSLMDYQNVVDRLKAKKGTWFRVYEGDVVGGKTVKRQLKKRGCVVHTERIDDDAILKAMWPDW